MTNHIEEARKLDQFPQPSRNDGGDPCGECHIKPGETCDICGAINKSANRTPITKEPTP